MAPSFGLRRQPYLHLRAPAGRDGLLTSLELWKNAMRIALVATYSHPIALGLRYISAYLKAHGQQVEMFFMRSKRDTADADFA